MKGTLKKICSSDRVKNVMKLHSFESLKLKSKSFYIIYHVVQNKKCLLHKTSEATHASQSKMPYILILTKSELQE